MAKIQAQLSSGLRLQRPSDDPVGVRTLLIQKARDVRLDTQIKNIGTATFRLNNSVSQLLDASKLITQARDIAIQAPSVLDSNEAELLAGQVDSLLDRLLALANTRDDDTFLFGGTKTESAPFVVTERNQNGTIAAIEYRGGSDSTVVTIGQGQSVEVQYSGADVFQTRTRQKSVLIGNTGAAIGAGTDNGIGTSQLEVTHTLTTYAAGSGVQAGSSSAAGDTVIGPAGAHVLTINDTSGTGASGLVSLNGGTPVPFASTDTDLVVSGPFGERVFVNTTAITAGFNGDVALTATGTLSIDGGLSSQSIDFSTNQQITDSQTGAVTNIDSSAVRRTGTDAIEYAGTADVFQSLIQLRDDLLNARDLEPIALQESLNRRLGDLDRVHNSMLVTVGRQSATLQNLETVQARAEDLQLEIAGVISDIESADVTKLAIDLQNETTLLQFTFASSMQLLNQNLLDFLR